MLEAAGIHVFYGPVPAVRGVDLVVNDGEAVALLGRNGAGKTTTLRALAGLMSPNRGTISFDGRRIDHVPAERRVNDGICLVPEGRGVFPQLTVQENLLMGAYHRRRRPKQLRDDVDRVTETFPRLAERLTQKAGSLSGGEQQMLAVARGLMGRPRLLLVDEPSLGLAPIVVEQLYESFRSLNREGIAMLIVEQYVELALDFAQRAYVLEKGSVALSGDAQVLASSREVIDTYMSAPIEEVPA